MKRSLFALIPLTWSVGITIQLNAADDQQNVGSQGKPPEFYPWSESSEFVRVPKGFIKQVTVQSVTVTNFENFRFTLAGEFIKLFRLTPSEVERLTEGIADAMHQYRAVQAQHLEPTKEELTSIRGPLNTPGILEKFNFRLNPFPEEANAIHLKLEESARTILGEERSKFFWEFGRVLDGTMVQFNQQNPVPAGMTRSTFITFLLRESQAESRIEIYKADMTRRIDGRPGGGTGMVGLPPGESLDRYAPVEMKPILARWRKTIAETKAKNATLSAKHPQPADSPKTPASILPAAKKSDDPPTVSPSHIQAVAQSDSRWDDAATFIDIPKTMIHSIRIPGLTVEGEISPEAITLFGLAPSESDAVHSLYHQMKARFEQLERAHFVRVEPGKGRFVLKAFPEKSADMQREWIDRLKELIGPTRAKLLDESIRSPISPMRFMRRGGPAFRDPIRDLSLRGPDWLHRGTAGVRVNISAGQEGRDGRPTLRLEYETQGGAGDRGTWNGPQDQLPERWRHLLTPDLLGVPLTF